MARLTIGVRSALTAGLMFSGLAIPIAFASDAMPAAQQNALVQKYCAVCHADAVRNGGLSLEHFDASQAAPSLVAMMVSKLTSGVLLETVNASTSDPAAAALVARKMKSGAMGAAGIPVPDKATIDSLIHALASRAKVADEWDVQRTQDPGSKAPLLTASILRELPSMKTAGEASMYRLVLACNAATHEGGMQLAWAPVPRMGTLSATVDGETRFTYKVEGSETMSNGSRGITGPAAAISLYPSENGSQAAKMTLPKRVLIIQDLVPNEPVEFSFANLSQSARQSLAACFKE